MLTNTVLRSLGETFKPGNTMDNVLAIKREWIKKVNQKHIKLSRRAFRLFEKKGPFPWMFQFLEFSDICRNCEGTGLIYNNADNVKSCFCTKSGHSGLRFNFR